MNLSELLKGCELLRDEGNNVVIQTIRNMMVAFLVTDPEFSFDDRFANPLTVAASNRGYGHLRMENPNPLDMIVAPQVAVMTKYAAQNHSMTKSALIRAQRQAEYHDAGCVQGSQSGYIRHGDHDIRFMPVSIRELLLEGIGSTKGYSHLYPAIRTLGQRTQSNTGEYIDKYFSKYDGNLNEFIAHFERPSNMIGVIILIDNEIVAIDKFPSFTYGKQVWDLLVRDCYGSLAIESIVNNKPPIENFAEVLEEVPQEENEGTIDYLFRSMNIFKQSKSEQILMRLEELMTVNFSTESDSDNSDNLYQSSVLKSDGYIGQSISSGEYHHLVSLCKRDKFDPDNLRQSLQTTMEYRLAAEKQREFTI